MSESMSFLVKSHPKLGLVNYKGNQEIVWTENPIAENNILCKILDASHSSLIGYKYPCTRLRSSNFFVSSPSLNYRHAGLVSRYLRHHTSGHEAPKNDLGPPLLHPSSNSNVCDSEQTNHALYGEFPTLFQEVHQERIIEAQPAEAQQTSQLETPTQPTASRASVCEESLHRIRRESGSSSSSRSSICIVRRTRNQPQRYSGPRAKLMLQLVLEDLQAVGVVEPRGEASTTVEARGEASTTVEPRGEASTTVEPRGEASTTVEPRGEASITVEAQTTYNMESLAGTLDNSMTLEDPGTRGEHEEAEEAIPHSTEPPVVNDETSNNAAQHDTAVPQVPQQQTREIVDSDAVGDLLNLEAEQLEVKRLSKVHEKTSIELRRTQAEHKKLTDLLKDCEARRDALAKRLTLEKQQLNLAIKKANRSKRRHVLQEKQARERARVGQVGEVQRQAQKRRQDDDGKGEDNEGKRVRYSPMQKEKKKPTRTRPVPFGSGFGGHSILKPKKRRSSAAQANSTTPSLRARGAAVLPDLVANREESSSSDSEEGEQDSCSSSDKLAALTVPNNSGLATGGVAGLGDKKTPGAAGSRGSDNACDMARGAASTGEPAARQSYVKPPIDPINSSLAAEGAAALRGEACDGHRPRTVNGRTRKSSTESLPATTAFYFTRSKKRATEEAAEDATGPSYGSSMGTEKTHNLRSSKSCKRRRSN